MLTLEQVAKKLEAHKAQQSAKAIGTVYARLHQLPWRPRLKVFSTRNWAFDPVTGDGHSYNWYALTKVIDGRLFLNTFAYSMSTSRHVWECQRVLDTLGLQYETLDAPQGLQDLEQALAHAAAQLARWTVKEKYARKPLGNWESKQKQAVQLNLQTLASLGFLCTAERLEACIADQERQRASKLARHRAVAKARVKIIAADLSMLPLPGLHVTRSTVDLSKWQRRDLMNEARAQGFSKVYVHIVQNVEKLLNF